MGFIRQLAIFIVLVLPLSGCAIFSKEFKPSHAWHAEDLDQFLAQNYPIGSDEKKLISDFTAHGYELHERKTPCVEESCTKSLSVPAYCSWFFGARYGVSIQFNTDADRRIKNISSRKIVCLLTF